MRYSAFIVAILIFCCAASQAQTAKNSAAGYRSVTIVTEPKASIWIDGVGWGKAGADGRLEIKTISPGPHSIRVRADGFKERIQPLTAAQKGEIAIALVKTTDEAELAFQEGERQSFQDREKAVAAYRKAIELRPNYPDAYVSLARALVEMLDTDGALEAIKAARKYRPGFAEATAVEGRIHKENGDDELAVAAFKKAIVEGKGFQPEAYAGLGLYYKAKAEAAGSGGDFTVEDANFAESAKNLKMSIKQLSGAPDTSVIYQLLGLIYERQKRYNEAIALYEEFLRMFPNSNDATAVRSFIEQLKKQMAENP
jgi:tetratricopeptide (TPR) repeat protein